MKIQNSKAGFTILESMIAISIFTIGISAALLVIVSSLNVGTRAKNTIIASNLAEEGIEVVRSIRDRNWMVGNPWYQGIDDPLGFISGACVQWDSDQVDQVCPSLLLGHTLIFNNVAHRYISQSDGAPSDFSRTITLDYCDSTHASSDGNTCDPARIHVTSAVTCGGGCNVSADEYLYDWK